MFSAPHTVSHVYRKVVHLVLMSHVRHFSKKINSQPNTIPKMIHLNWRQAFSNTLRTWLLHAQSSSNRFPWKRRNSTRTLLTCYKFIWISRKRSMSQTKFKSTPPYKIKVKNVVNWKTSAYCGWRNAWRLYSLKSVRHYVKKSFCPATRYKSVHWGSFFNVWLKRKVGIPK